MGWPDTPVPTETEALHKEHAEQAELLSQLVQGYNEMGANVAWLVDNVKGIFQMFGSPQFMAQMGQMMSGGIGGPGPGDAGSDGNDGNDGDGT